MFKCLLTVYLRATDATGALYFSEQLRLALEAFEEFLYAQGFTLKTLLQDRGYLMPIVHAEADFKAPLFAGDRVVIELALKNQGASSFALATRFIDPQNGEEKGSSRIVHVTVDKKTGKACEIPEELKGLLAKLGS